MNSSRMGNPLSCLLSGWQRQGTQCAEPEHLRVNSTAKLSSGSKKLAAGISWTYNFRVTGVPAWSKPKCFCAIWIQRGARIIRVLENRSGVGGPPLGKISFWGAICSGKFGSLSEFPSLPHPAYWVAVAALWARVVQEVPEGQGQPAFQSARQHPLLMPRIRLR